MASAAIRSATFRCMERMEWQVSRQCALVLERRRRTLNEFATRLSGSSDLYQDDGRKPYASINFVTCHDGFNLHDLVSYTRNTNDANGEDIAMARTITRAGTVVPKDPRKIRKSTALRWQQKRNFIATLILSQGVPMLLAGDELGHTQQATTTPMPGQRADLDRLGAIGGRTQLSRIRQTGHFYSPQPAGVSAP